MKKFFVVLGVVFASLIVLGIIFISIAVHTRSKLDTESKVYVDHVVPLIVASWDSKELLNHASPELLKVAPADKIDSMFKMLAEKLGKYKEFKDSKGGSFLNFTPQGKIITAAYITHVAFDRADATVRIRVIKHSENWQVLEFYVDSQALMP